ncbi:MAG: ATP-binding protein [Gemmatimonadetes bacterium]|nr:ATP-binding protein [Gemmatimonadota bacterium]
MRFPEWEKLGVFYLGRRFDLESRAVVDEPVLYDARDLTTHGVCVGMTGSGKTGLCLSLLEEAAIDGIPAIAIDPKGDIGNLLLTFPDLAPQDFAPWLAPGEAERHGRSTAEHAQAVAESWRGGLASWGQDGDRIRRLREAADFAIYTPGSTAGRPLSLLRSFRAPEGAARDEDALRERVMAAVSALMSLVGLEPDPVKSREHILLSRLLDEAWRTGSSLELADLIRQIQKPPFDRIGVIALETFFPEKDRFVLAMTLNNLLASPGFAAWLEGEPLEVGRLLWTPRGQPRVSILSIAHLTDAERMFFVTTLLGEVVAWMRAQPGTTSLRALLYMDEVFGFFPPVANPPSKPPMLTLMKQARAFGLGVLLATQNPVDLDYKSLSNAGTWFIGRLQTERDKARMLDGLESIAGGTPGMDRAAIDRILSALDSRVFLMHDVHEDGPVILHTRWAMSYLRGPLTRQEIRRLSAADERAAEHAAPATAAPAPIGTTTAQPAASAAADSAHPRPVVPASLDERFLRAAGDSGDEPGRLYKPALLGRVRLHHVDARRKVDAWRDLALLGSLAEDAADPWDDAEEFDETGVTLDREPVAGFAFAEMPAITDALVDAWRKKLIAHAYRARKLVLWRCAELRELSGPSESEGEFRIRLSQRAREQRDAEVDALRTRYGSRLQALEDRRRTAQQRVEREQSQYQQQKLQAAISVGATVLGALFGRKVASARNVGRITTAARGAGRVGREAGDVGRAQDSLEAVDAKIAALDAELEAEIAKLQAGLDPTALPLEAIEISARKSDISAAPLVLLWRPWRTGTDGLARPIG